MVAINLVFMRIENNNCQNMAIFLHKIVVTTWLISCIIVLFFNLNIL